PGIGPVEKSLEEWREKLGELERDCEQAESRLDGLKAATKAAREDFDARVLTLRTALRRFTQAPGEPPPLIAIAEQEPAANDSEIMTGPVAEAARLEALRLEMAKLMLVVPVEH